MSLSLALGNALSGIRVNQSAIQVLSQNVANVNTPGYSRQVVGQSTLIVNGMGMGVKIDEITRKIDQYLQRSTITQSTSTNAAAALDDFYQRVQGVLGQPGAANSIDSFMTNYFNSLQRLGETPEINSIKANAVNSGVTLARQLSGLAESIYDMRLEADAQIADAVDEVNAALENLYNLNAQLNTGKSLNQPTASLEDLRDKELSTLAKYMNINVSYGPAGQVGVVGGNGFALVEDGVRHQLRYSKAASANSFISDTELAALQIITLNDAGTQVGATVNLISGGASSTVTPNLASGKLYGLQQIRDVKFLGILNQLDELSTRLRDNVNAIHNSGTSFPPATALTGTRPVRPTDQYNWQGSVRIAVLNADGTPVLSPYADEATSGGIRPLTLDLSQMNSGDGLGKPTLQHIIDEINGHFGPPSNKAKLGNLNNIQLVADTDFLPSGATSLFNFDLELDNISEQNAQVFVTGVSVTDASATSVATAFTQPATTYTILPNASYSTVSGTSDVTISLSELPDVAPGEMIYLAAPTAATVNGISAANLTGFFTVTAVSGNQVTFTAGGPANATGAVSDAGNIKVQPPYERSIAGFKQRTKNQGELQVDFTSSSTSAYYDVTLNVSVIGEDGVVNTAPITYRVLNNRTGLINDRYGATAVSSPATLVLADGTQSSLRAIMVDENGKELPKFNGDYLDQEGFLKIVGGAGGHTVAIDSLDSKQMGKTDVSPQEPGTNRGFSHYFGLNDFFAPNAPIDTGDTLRNSAYNLQVVSRLQNDPNLIPIGKISQVSSSPATNNATSYAYALYSGDNSVIQAMAQLNTQTVDFDAAGGLPTTRISLQSYASEMLGFVAQQSAVARDNAANSQALYESFKSRSEAISSVNLDEELANTVVLQNSYAASARVITIVNKMFDDLLQIF